MDQNWCPSLDLIMPPAKPINLNGFNASKGTVNLSWNRNTEIDLKGYNVYKDGVWISTDIKNFITVTGLKVGRTYKFQVQSLDIFNDVSNTALINVYISKWGCYKQAFKEGLIKDIDLCISYIGKSKGTIVEEIDDIIGIYSCDIVFVDSLNENIEKQIGRDGIEIYSKI